MYVALGSMSGLKTRWKKDPYCDFNHVDGVPASFDLVRSIPSFFYQQNTSKSMIKIPQVHRGHATFKVPKAMTYLFQNAGLDFRPQGKVIHKYNVKRTLSLKYSF